jgi:hypothetical protein
MNAMRTSPFGGPRYSENEERKSRPNSTPCAWCGLPINEGREQYFVEVFDGGSRWARTTDDPETNEAARADSASYMGFFPVGAACKRVLQADDVVIRKEEPQ